MHDSLQKPFVVQDGRAVVPDGRAPAYVHVAGAANRDRGRKIALEKRIAAALRESPAGRGVKPRALDVLVREARTALERWKTDRGPLPADLGRFLIESETAQDSNPVTLASFDAVRRQWTDRAASYRTAADGAQGENAVRIVRERLFADYLQLYSRHYARFVDFMEYRGGNCEAQTKLILSAIAASNVELPEHQVFGVQVFRDHVQAVIYI